MRQVESRVADVAIVGAGPAGAATAIHLARAGMKVVLVDRASFPRDKPCAEYLSPAAEPLLRKLGVLDEIEQPPPGRLRGFRIYAPNGRMFQGDFAATQGSRDGIVYETGLAVPRLRLDMALVTGACRAGADFRSGWQLSHLQQPASKEWWTLFSSSNLSPIRARLLIAADGVHSTVARRLNLHVPSRMRKVALVAHMRGISGLTSYGEMHVAGRRYVGLAPLEMASSEALCNVAMVVDEARDGRQVARQRPETFLRHALETFPRLRGRTEHAVVERKVLATSRIRVRSRRLSGDALLLVGDAGGYYDPFTGEGIYRALRGAELAADVALRALIAGDLSAKVLASYDATQRQEFRGKRAIEAIVQAAVQVPPLMDHIALRMERHKEMADRVVAVTGDFLPAESVLRPGFLLCLIT